MSTPPNIDRKAFLSSSLAMAALALSGCSSGTSGGSGGAASGGSPAGAGGPSGGASTAGSATAGTSTDLAGSGGADVSTGGSVSGGGVDTGGTGGEGIGGMGAGGGTFSCMTETSNGMHSHPLTVPGKDVDQGYQDAPYLLEDGGTGHTHTLEVSAYEFIYLRAGVTRQLDSSTDAGHKHTCVITCSLG